MEKKSLKVKASVLDAQIRRSFMTLEQKRAKRALLRYQTGKRSALIAFLQGKE